MSGMTEHPELLLSAYLDEALTPDSSRYWDRIRWAPGLTPPSFDKQYVRDWLLSAASGWDRAADTPPPRLPGDVVRAVSYTHLTLPTSDLV